MPGDTGVAGEAGAEAMAMAAEQEQRTAQAVVVGAGAFGTSVAFHLAKLGWRDVVLLDRFELASQTSPRAAGLTAQARGTDLMTRLAMRSVEQLTRFGDETGEALELFQPGSIKIARTPEHEARLEADVARGRRLGLEIDLVSPAEVHRRAPFVAPAGILAATYVPSDLYLEPGQVPRAYARAAGRLGVTLLPHTAVTGIMVTDGVVQGVRTAPRGSGAPAEIRAPVVVDAAGAWTRQVGELAGRRIPAVPTRHQLLITAPVAGVTPDQPIVRVIDANVYVRPERGGLLMGGYEDDPQLVDVRRLPPEFGIDDLQLDLSVLHRLARLVVDQFPVLDDLLAGRLAVREHRGGLPTMTADGKHIVGPVPGLRGFYAATGCCVGGLSISPAIGQCLAELILTGTPSLSLDEMAITRFGAEVEDDDALRSAAVATYAHQYGGGWEEAVG
jgi:glycine/D-amino acid oxidase-like deaminating enzyme